MRIPPRYAVAHPVQACIIEIVDPNAGSLAVEEEFILDTVTAAPRSRCVLMAAIALAPGHFARLLRRLWERGLVMGRETLRLGPDGKKRADWRARIAAYAADPVVVHVDLVSAAVFPEAYRRSLKEHSSRPTMPSLHAVSDFLAVPGDPLHIALTRLLTVAPPSSLRQSSKTEGVP